MPRKRRYRIRQGIPCVKCRGDTIVIDSRERGDDIKRRRKCLECGERFNTLEKVQW